MAGTNIFCIARIDIADNYQKKGLLTSILKLVESETYFSGVEVENIMNQDLTDILSKKGYMKKYKPHDIVDVPTMFKMN